MPTQNDHSQTLCTNAKQSFTTAAHTRHSQTLRTRYKPRTLLRAVLHADDAKLRAASRQSTQIGDAQGTYTLLFTRTSLVCRQMPFCPKYADVPGGLSGRRNLRDNDKIMTMMIMTQLRHLKPSIRLTHGVYLPQPRQPRQPQSASTAASIIRSRHQRFLTELLTELDVRRGTASNTCLFSALRLLEDRSGCLSLCRTRTALDGPRAVRSRGASRDSEPLEAQISARLSIRTCKRPRRLAPTMKYDARKDYRTASLAE